MNTVSELEALEEATDLLRAVVCLRVTLDFPFATTSSLAQHGHIRHHLKALTCRACDWPNGYPRVRIPPPFSA